MARQERRPALELWPARLGLLQAALVAVNGGTEILPRGRCSCGTDGLGVSAGLC